jgi:hypothetical protein
VVLLLPSVARRAVISLLVLLHFGGILTAVINVSPPTGDAPWLANQAWTRFYRYYLQFMYLNNAYHFYSPEPGPPTLLWFHIDYSDGSSQWVRLPERGQFPTRQQYQRRLALTESTNMLVPPLPIFRDDIREAREEAGKNPSMPIPALEGVPASLQYRLPSPYSGFMVATYARHVAHDYPSKKDPTAEVTGVKVYRVVHLILNPEQFREGLSPTDPTSYWPFYQGEFDQDGNMKARNDPFQYWIIPIRWCPEIALPFGFPEDAIIDRRVDPTIGKIALVDFTRIHVLMKTARPPR